MLIRVYRPVEAEGAQDNETTRCGVSWHTPTKKGIKQRASQAESTQTNTTTEKLLGRHAGSLISQLSCHNLRLCTGGFNVHPPCCSLEKPKEPARIYPSGKNTYPAECLGGGAWCNSACGCGSLHLATVLCGSDKDVKELRRMHVKKEGRCFDARTYWTTYCAGQGSLCRRIRNC